MRTLLTEEEITRHMVATSTYVEAEKMAENLTYSISYEHKKGEWRTRYEYLRQEDFRAVGWNVICVGTKSKFLSDWLLKEGFIRFADKKIYYKKDKMEMFMIDEYGSGVIVSIDNYRGNDPSELISLDEYKSLLIGHLVSLRTEKIKLMDFISSLIQDHKEFIEKEEDDYLKEQIIAEALERAKKAGLIK